MLDSKLTWVVRCESISSTNPVSGISIPHRALVDYFLKSMTKSFLMVGLGLANVKFANVEPTV